MAHFLPVRYAGSMHVCVLQTVLTPFKGGNHLSLLAAASEVQFTIVCNRSRVQEDDLPSNVRVITVHGRTGPYYYGCKDFRFAQILLRIHPPISDFWKQFDVIHCNQVMGPALKKLRATDVPLLLLIHHPVTADREVALAESGLIAGLQWRARYALLSRWQKHMCAAAHHVATVSQTVKQRIADDYHCPEERISIVPNGVDGAVFASPDGTTDFDVIAVGSFIHPRKGLPYLLQAYRALAAKGYRIADVGRRSDEQRASLQAIPGVTHYGTVPNDELVSLVKRSAVLISTSLYEGFGLSLIEALACGRPAFAFNGGAVDEVLSPIDADLVVPLRDMSTLVQRVDAFLQLPAAEREARGRGYRTAVLDRYPIKQSAAALTELYRSLDSRRKS